MALPSHRQNRESKEEGKKAEVHKVFKEAILLG